MTNLILAFIFPALFHSDTAIVTLKPKSMHTIYLTFDGGPVNSSKKVNAIILNECVRATVFLKGSNIWEHGQFSHYHWLYRDNPYIKCCNGGFLHFRSEHRYYAYPEDVLYDFALNDYFMGFSNLVCRLPERNSWRISGRDYDESPISKAGADILALYDCKVFGWDIEWEQDRWTGLLKPSANDMADIIDRYFEQNKTFTRGHLVLRCHDKAFNRTANEKEMKMLIEELKHKGNYKFDYLTSYPEQSLISRSQ